MKSIILSFVKNWKQRREARTKITNSLLSLFVRTVHYKKARYRLLLINVF